MYPAMRIRLQNELLLINILAILLIIVITFFPSNVLRIILGLPLLLFFPGYTLIVALFPRKNALASIERVALSFGLSIAVVPLIGLILNHTLWGIRLEPILTSITIFIVVTSLIALVSSVEIGSGREAYPFLQFKSASMEGTKLRRQDSIHYPHSGNTRS